jgi:hypothetical protein
LLLAVVEVHLPSPVVVRLLLLVAEVAREMAELELPLRQQDKPEQQLLVAPLLQVKAHHVFLRLVHFSWVEMDVVLRLPETVAVVAAAVILAAVVADGVVQLHLRSTVQAAAVQVFFTQHLQHLLHSNSAAMVCGKTLRIH